jgi:UPF0042 nucleotide-binding protein
MSEAPEAKPTPVVIVTGMSGAGRSSALKVFEDIGYEAVDNLPLQLLQLLVHPEKGLARPLAIGIDIRTRDFEAAPILTEIARLKSDPRLEARVLFLECEDEILGRRFTETRRRHPLAIDRPLLDGIRRERQLMTPLREKADLVIDTSRLAPGLLKQRIEAQFALEGSPGLMVFVTSFSYRLGLPREADLVFDARFLTNPHYVQELRPLTGRDPAVAAYIAADPDFESFFANLTSLVGPLLPRFEAEGKSYLTLAVGCTGGRHRSVFLAEKLAAWLSSRGEKVELRHRELAESESKV